jgi:hypothetical protein
MFIPPNACSRLRHSVRCWGTYGTLWARARSVAYWRKVVTSGEWARLGIYAVEAYGIFKVSPLSVCLFLLGPFVDGAFRLGRLLGVGRLLGITCSRHHTANTRHHNRFLFS